jgi:hypothetical protein
MKLSIIILQHNTPTDVNANLQKLSQANLPKQTEIIIVNNGGNQANQKLKLPTNLNIKTFETPNHGFATGNNFGYKKASPNSDYYLFLNPDIEVNPNTIQDLIQYMEQNPKVGITSPQLIYPDGSTQDNYRKFPNPIDLIIKRTQPLHKLFQKRLSNYLMWNRDPNNTQAVDWVTGAFTLISKNCMLSIKQHDQTYFMFMSDVILCMDAWQKGFEVHIVGKTKALHNDQRVSHGGFLDIFRKKTLRIHILDSLRYFIKNPLKYKRPTSSKQT